MIVGEHGPAAPPAPVHRTIVTGIARKIKKSLDALFWIKEIVVFEANDIATSEYENAFYDSLATTSRRLLAKDAGKMSDNKKMILVLGLGNSLLSDDGAGPLAIELLGRSPVGALAGVALRDGGTIGLSLLPEIEDCDAFIAIDAASFGAEPGTVRVFEGEAMDAMLAGNKKTAHEVALADLMGAAALAGSRPARRALVAVQPASIAIGMEPTAPVMQAMPLILEAAENLILSWRGEPVSPPPPVIGEAGAC